MDTPIFKYTAVELEQIRARVRGGIFDALNVLDANENQEEGFSRQRQKTMWEKLSETPALWKDHLFCLSRKKEIVLRGYLCSGSLYGYSYIFASEANEEFEEPDLLPRHKISTSFFRRNVPCPKKARKCVMDAFEGGRTPDAYLEASMLLRELEEFGASGHNEAWRAHYILDSADFSEICISWCDWRILHTPTRQLEEFDWKVPIPESLKPSVCVTEAGSVVRYYTVSCFRGEAIYEVVDSYGASGLCPKTVVTKLATGGSGYRV